MEELKKFKKKIEKEAILKSIFLSLTVGFLSLTVTAGAFWFFGVKNIWLPLVLFAVISGGTFPLWYFKIFKPSTKQIASRIDALGLDERILTMSEFKNDNSYIAKRQREDALKVLKTIGVNLVKLVIPVSMIICLAITSLFGVGSQVLNTLASTGKIESGNKVIVIDDPKNDVYYEVLFVVEGEGVLAFDGSKDLDEVCYNVKAGEEFPSVVTATAKDNNVFVGWYLGIELISEEADVVITDVQQDLVIMAIFQEFEEGEEGEGEGDEGDSEEGEDQPQEGEGDSEEEGDQPSDAPNGNEGSSWDGNNPNNNLLDGETSYDAVIGEGSGDGDGVGGAYLGALGGN